MAALLAQVAQSSHSAGGETLTSAPTSFICSCFRLNMATWRNLLGSPPPAPLRPSLSWSCCRSWTASTPNATDRTAAPSSSGEAGFRDPGAPEPRSQGPNSCFLSLSRDLLERLAHKWSTLRGCGASECVRTYLTVARKWPLFGAKLYSAEVTGPPTQEVGR